MSRIEIRRCHRCHRTMVRNSKDHWECVDCEQSAVWWKDFNAQEPDTAIPEELELTYKEAEKQLLDKLVKAHSEIVMIVLFLFKKNGYSDSNSVLLHEAERKLAEAIRELNTNE